MNWLLSQRCVKMCKYVKQACVSSPIKTSRLIRWFSSQSCSVSFSSYSSWTPCSITWLALPANDTMPWTQTKHTSHEWHINWTELSIRNWLIQIIKQLLLITAATGVTIVLYCTFNRMTVMGCPSLFLNIFSHRRSWNRGKWMFTFQITLLY